MGTGSLVVITIEIIALGMAKSTNSWSTHRSYLLLLRSIVYTI